MRDNGAIEGAASAFEEDDEVIVMQHKDGEVIKVIGHVDGIVKCKGEYLLVSMAKCIFSPYPDGGIIFGENCIVWDLKSNKMATKIPLNTFTPENPQYASFPCSRNSISLWINASSTPDVYGNIFDSYGDSPRNEICPAVPPDTYDLNASGSGHGERDSYPLLLGEKDKTSWARTYNIIQSSSVPFEGGTLGIGEYTRTALYEVFACFPIFASYYSQKYGSPTRGLKLKSYFENYTDTTCYYKISQYYMSNYTLYEYIYHHYGDWIADTYRRTVIETENAEVELFFSSPFGGSYNQNDTSSATRTYNVIDHELPQEGDGETTVIEQEPLEGVWGDLAFGAIDLYSKNNIVHVSNLVIQTILTQNFGFGGGNSYNIAHHVEANTLNCNDTSVINPLTATNNLLLKNAVKSLLELEYQTNGALIPGQNGYYDYRVYGQIIKSE